MTQCPSRRETLSALAAGFGAALLGQPIRLSRAQEITYFRIATGSAGGTYFPVGGLIANAISNPPGSRDCERGGSCGAPGVIAVAQSTHGSVQNAELIDSGMIESGFCQADVAYWAFTGSALFAEKGPLFNLRSIANLYPEAVHLVIRKDANIHEMSDLRGRRLSIDRPGSGTQADALLILEAFGLGPDDYEAVSVGTSAAAQMLRDGEIDGFFFVAGTPATVISGLAHDTLIDLLPIDGAVSEELRSERPFFTADRIAAGTYTNVGYTETLSVGAQWLVGAQVDDELVYQLTQALWHENSRQLLDSGHPKGKLIRLETALSGLGVPLHPGAARFYTEQGLAMPRAIPPARPRQIQ